jgi:hypothetical protein
MNAGSPNVGDGKILHLSRFRVEPGDFIGRSEVGDPQVTVLVGSGAKGMRLGAGMSYSTYTMFSESPLNGRTVAL